MRVACLTMARDEGLFLEIWFRYYSAEFGAENCYVLDHASGDRAALERIAAAGGQVLRVPFQYPAHSKDGIKHDAPIHFDAYRFALINQFKGVLHQFYDVVIFNDADELFLPDPALAKGLAAHIGANRRAYAERGVISGIGIELFHDIDAEPAFDPARPVLAQRRNFCFRVNHTKPAILFKPARISPHGVDRPFAIDPALHLLHLKFLDHDEVAGRQALRHAAYSRGEVNAQTRWTTPSEETGRLFRDFMERPRGEGEGAHRDFLARHFARGKDGFFTAEVPNETKPAGPPPRRSWKRRLLMRPAPPQPQTRGGMVLARNGLDRAAVKALEARRYRLPERYEHSGV